MIKDFDAQTQEKAAGKHCVLLLDGHNSYHATLFLRYVMDHNIDVLGYPHTAPMFCKVLMSFVSHA